VEALYTFNHLNYKINFKNIILHIFPNQVLVLGNNDFKKTFHLAECYMMAVICATDSNELWQIEDLSNNLST